MVFTGSVEVTLLTSYEHCGELSTIQDVTQPLVARETCIPLLLGRGYWKLLFSLDEIGCKEVPAPKTSQSLWSLADCKVAFSYHVCLEILGY